MGRVWDIFMLKIMDFGGAIAMRDKSNPFLLETSPIREVGDETCMNNAAA